jgi:hypothetical protein
MRLRTLRRPSRSSFSHSAIRSRLRLSETADICVPPWARGLKGKDS